LTTDDLNDPAHSIEVNRKFLGCQAPATVLLGLGGIAALKVEQGARRAFLKQPGRRIEPIDRTFVGQVFGI
jgi:hypothetical protein